MGRTSVGPLRTERLRRRPAAWPAAGRLLLVFAHPDDESFFTAGTVARHVATGGDAVLVSATRGERGSQPVPPVCPQAELGRVRSRELRAACRVMGVRRLTFLGYEDGTLGELDGPDADEATRRVAGVMARYRPQAVVTFGPEGVYRHPDHVAVHRFTVEAFNRVFGGAEEGGDGNPRLWYVALSSAFWRYRPHDWVAAANEEAGREPSRRPLVPGEPEAAIDITATLGTKMAALLAHRSQRHNVERAFGGHYDFAARAPASPDALTVLGREFFTLARGPRPAYLLEDSLLDPGL